MAIVVTEARKLTPLFITLAMLGLLACLLLFLSNSRDANNLTKLSLQAAEEQQKMNDQIFFLIHLSQELNLFIHSIKDNPLKIKDRLTFHDPENLNLPSYMQTPELNEKARLISNKIRSNIQFDQYLITLAYSGLLDGQQLDKLLSSEINSFEYLNGKMVALEGLYELSDANFDNYKVLVATQIQKIQELNTKATQATVAASFILVLLVGIFSFDKMRAIRKKANLDIARRDAANRSHFLSHMSHELKTPLNGILGSFQILQANPNYQQDAQIIHLGLESTHKINSMINNILLYIQLDGEQWSANNDYHDLKSHLYELLTKMQAKAHKKGLTLSTKGIDSISHDIFCDAVLFVRSIENIIDNAIKFSDQGCIHIEVHKSDNAIKITVADQGVGITPDQLLTIQNPLTQGDSSYTKKHQGLGLGISLSRKIMARLGGMFDIESELSKGTKVSLILPFS